MKKTLTLLVFLALVLAGCGGNQPKKGHGMHAHHEHSHFHKEHKSEMNTKKKPCGCSMDNQVSNTDDTPQDITLSLKDVNLLNSDELVVLQKFKDIISRTSITAYSKGIDAEIKTYKQLNMSEYKKLAAKVADTIRENRGVSGKVKVFYMIDGKEVSAKF